MSTIGAEMGQLQQLGQRFMSESHTVAQLTSTISGQVANTWWKGPAADRLGTHCLFLGVQQILEFAHELADVAELAIDRGEADIRHLVEPLRLRHHPLPAKRSE